MPPVPAIGMSSIEPVSEKNFIGHRKDEFDRVMTIHIALKKAVAS
jgi:hypothetical protein